MIILFLILKAIFNKCNYDTTVVKGHYMNTKQWGRVWVPAHKRKVRRKTY